MLLRLLKRIRYAWTGLLSSLVGFPLFLKSVHDLVGSRRLIRNADVLVVFEEGGFGHTIASPDIARRLYPERKIVFVVVSGGGRHNLDVCMLWPENLKLLFFPIKWRSPWPGLGAMAVRQICMRLKRPNSLYFGSILDLYHDLCLKFPEHVRGIDTNLNIRWIAGYFALIDATVNTLPPRLSKEVVECLWQALKLPRTARIASIYLRQKNGGDSTNSARSGSPFVDYLPAVRFLQSRGYSVLVVGDVDVPDDYRQGPLAVVERSFALSAGIHSDLFYLFSISAASLCVSECGGGAWLPLAMEKSHLCTNAFPYFYAMKGAWMLPKRIRNTEGVLISPIRLFSDFAYKYDVGSDLVLESNTQDDLLEAMIEFVSDVESGKAPTLSGIDGQMQGTLYPSARAGICRTWLRPYSVQLGSIGT